MNVEEIENRLIKEEVYTNQTLLVFHLIHEGIFTQDMVENMFIYNIELSTGKLSTTNHNRVTEKLEEVKEKVWTLEDEISDLDIISSEHEGYTEGEQADEEIKEKNALLEVLQEDVRNLETAKSQPQEIYEWYAVSGNLLDALRDKGHPIIDNDFGEWWGRTCTGQDIKLDGIFNELATDMLNKF